MIEKIFSKEEVNTGRQPEVDFMKAYCIIMMMITHTIDDLFIGYESNLPSFVINNVLAQSVGAHAFMISMGVGMVFTKKSSPKLYAERGLSILVSGQVLNLFRYALFPGVLYVVKGGDEWARAMMFLTYSVDILQFAGLFFLCMALFTKLRLKPLHIFIIAVLANAVGMLIGGKFSTGSYAVDQIIGFFVFTKTESYFPLIHWMVYPAFGILFGDILKHVKDKRAFYRILFIPCSILMVVYYYIGINYEQPFFTVFNDWRTFCHPGLPDVIMQLFANTAILSLCYFIAELLPEKVMKGAGYISKNINRFYCIHIVLISFFAYIILEIMEFDYFTSAIPTYIFALCLIILTTVCVIIDDKYINKYLREFTKGRRGAVLAAAVFLISIIVCVWAYPEIETFTNMWNDYTL